MLRESVHFIEAVYAYCILGYPVKCRIIPRVQRLQTCWNGLSILWKWQVLLQVTATVWGGYGAGGGAGGGAVTSTATTSDTTMAQAQPGDKQHAPLPSFAKWVLSNHVGIMWARVGWKVTLICVSTMFSPSKYMNCIMLADSRLCPGLVM